MSESTLAIADDSLDFGRPASVEGRPQVREAALAFDCHGERLLGILSRPASTAAAAIGVVIVVGGPQYRAGSHRQFVALARHLAAAGHAVLRFDGRGMGDSSGAQRSFEDFGDDIGAAIDALQSAEPDVTRVVLWGLCDAASAALLYLDATADRRVAGLALLNPWVRSAASLARTHVKHYYRQRLMDGAFWRKLLTGGVALGAVTGLVANLHAARGRQRAVAGTTLPFQQRMARAWAGFDGPVLLMLSEKDYTAREFGEFIAADGHWQQALKRRPPHRVPLADADHTCSSAGARAAAERATVGWLAGIAGSA